ncbi:putative mitochondrial protein, partial [Sesamum alatum]
SLPSLSKAGNPGFAPPSSFEQIERARIDAQDRFEVKVEIIRQMAPLDPDGDWERRGARASQLHRPLTLSLIIRIGIHSRLKQMNPWIIFRPTFLGALSVLSVASSIPEAKRVVITDLKEIFPFRNILMISAVPKNPIKGQRSQSEAKAKVFQIQINPIQFQNSFDRRTLVNVGEGDFPSAQVNPLNIRERVGFWRPQRRRITQRMIRTWKVRSREGK